MFFAQAVPGQIDWTTVITVGMAVFGSICTGICTLATLYIKTKAAGFEARIKALEERSEKCEAERLKDQVEHAKEIEVRDSMLNTEWPSDDFSHGDLVQKIHRIASAKGIPITLAQVAALIKKIKANRDRDRKASTDEEFFP